MVSGIEQLPLQFRTEVIAFCHGTLPAEYVGIGAIKYLIKAFENRKAQTKY